MGAETYAAMSPLTQVDEVQHADAGPPRRRGPHAARSARPSSGTPRCASAACRPQLVLYPEAVAPLHPARPALAPPRLQPPRPRLGRAVRRTRPAAAPRIDAAHWQRRLTTLAAKHRVPGASSASCVRPVGDELVEAATGVLNKTTGVAVTTDSLFQIGSITQGVDGDGRHAARRRGAARPGRPDRRGAARAAARRPRRHQAGHHAAPAHAHQRHRRRRVHRHRPRRRLPGEVRRRARRRRPEPPARRDLVLLQLRLRRCPAG